MQALPHCRCLPTEFPVAGTNFPGGCHTKNPARPLVGTKIILTADIADTRGCASPPRRYLSARIRVIRGCSSYSAVDDRGPSGDGLLPGSADGKTEPRWKSWSRRLWSVTWNSRTGWEDHATASRGDRLSAISLVWHAGCFYCGQPTSFARCFPTDDEAFFTNSLENLGLFVNRSIRLARFDTEAKML